MSCGRKWLKKVSPRLRLVVKREFILVMGLEWRRGRDRTIARGAMTSPQQLWPFWIIAVTSLMTTKLCSGLTVWYADLVDPTLSPANLQVSCLSLCPTHPPGGREMAADADNIGRRRRRRMQQRKFTFVIDDKHLDIFPIVTVTRTKPVAIENSTQASVEKRN